MVKKTPELAEALKEIEKLSESLSLAQKSVQDVREENYQLQLAMKLHNEELQREHAKLKAKYQEAAEAQRVAQMVLERMRFFATPCPNCKRLYSSFIWNSNTFIRMCDTPGCSKSHAPAGSMSIEEHNEFVRGINILLQDKTRIREHLGRLHHGRREGEIDTDPVSDALQKDTAQAMRGDLA